MLGYGPAEWDALPYWQVAVFRKGLAERWHVAANMPAGDEPAAESGTVSDEGLAELEARGIRVIRQG